MKELPKRGDVVDILPENLPSSMSHFTTGRAVVLDSYSAQYGGDNDRSFTVMFEDGDRVSWYGPENMVFVRHAGEAYISEVRMAREARDREACDLDWIVAHWPESRARAAALETLMRLLGITNPWGRHGEGMEYYSNVQGTLAVLGPALGTGDVAKVRAAAQAFLDAEEQE